MTPQIPVCIIGSGPIGLAGSLLLAKFGIRSLIVERRGEVNTHPRSRFVDTNSMELMRLLGVEREIEATGLGPEWTACNRWFNALTKDEVAAIASPTFHSVPRMSSPSVPVMTCQDYVENVLIERVLASELIELRYLTEATQIDADDDGVAILLRDHAAQVDHAVRADYVLGTDGPHSFARRAIGSEMQATPRQQYAQDVIFEADLSAQVAQRKGGLLYCMTVSGVLVFQPLNGLTRWRCQIFKPDPEQLSEDEIIARIRLAVGVDDLVISISSTGIWQPTPGCVDQLGRGRVFLAGDAAHVSLPTGGMGNNIGFTGIRNLTWKLAFVLNGWAAAEILDTYQVEHRPLALDRIQVGIQTTEYMGRFIRAYYQGEDTRPGIAATQQYGDYDGALLNAELASSLIAIEPSAPPPIANPTIDYYPCIRAGRRAPHLWIDEAGGQSVLDWFGTEYVVLAGSGVEASRWRHAVASFRDVLPLRLHQLALEDPLYAADRLILVRPDGVVADHWLDADIAASQESARLARYLPS